MCSYREHSTVLSLDIQLLRVASREQVPNAEWSPARAARVPREICVAASNSWCHTENKSGSGGVQMIAVHIVAVLCTGLYAGIILGDRLGASHARVALSSHDFVVFQQIQHVHFKPVLMPLTLLGLLSCLLWVGVALRSPLGLPFWLAAAGALVFACAFAVTRIVNFPINDALMTWDAASPPVNLREQWVPWEKAHTERAILATAAFALLAVSLALGSRGL
jgi:uncharacterized membrane protein